MPNTNNNQKAKKSNARKTSSTSAQSNVSNTVQTQEAPKRNFVPKEIDSTQYVIVRNGFQGRLIYQSRRTGEVFEWNEFGAEQEMELRELLNAKNSKKKFFINNWFMFDEDWIIDYLGLRQYYKNAIPIDDFDDIFDKSAEELKSIISKLSDGQKKSVAYRAKELIAENKIDSLSVISAIEDALGIELIER